MNDTDFSPDDIIKSVVDDISSLSAEHVTSIIEKANEAGKAIEMGDYIIEHRPDLDDAVDDAVGVALARF